MKDKLLKLAKGRERESAKEQGFFDGRFRPRVIKDKKKEKSRKKSRERIKIWDI